MARADDPPAGQAGCPLDLPSGSRRGHLLTLRRVDIRFALPEPIDRALVLGELQGWREGLQAAGAELVGSEPMVVAATAALVERAVSVGAPFALVEGRGAARSLSRAYGHVSRFLAAPNLEAPELLLPLDDPVASVYALDNVVPGSPRWKAARNRIVSALISRGAFPDVRPVLTVATPKAAPPFVVAAAETLGIPGDARWFLTLGRGDALSRAVFHLFPLGAAVPAARRHAARP